MIYEKLFDRISNAQVVRTAVIGTGHFATAIITQAQAMARLEVPVVVDIDVEAARRAYAQAGLTGDAVVVCETGLDAKRAFARGQRIILSDPTLLSDLEPEMIDVVVESTGVPEAGARHALAAFRQEKHVAMVNKETDATVGPMLKYLADEAGLVYTAVDGDQHGLLIGLVAWARELGLEVLCGGKARDAEFIYDPAAQTVSHRQQSVQLTQAQAQSLAPVKPGETVQSVRVRHEILGELPQVQGYDLVELAIAANATGLMPDIETVHGPVLRISEIPEVLCPVEEGGIMQQRGVIEAVTCLRQPHEAGLGGGVFIVVACDNAYSRHILTTKGLIANQRRSTALIFRPYHLCGVETPMTLLCAGLLGLATGATDYRPRVDVVARAGVDLKAGQRLGNDHSPELQVLLRPAGSVRPDAPLPLHLGNGNPLRVDVPAGTLITASMVEEPPQSSLWALRRQQDRQFMG